MMAFVARVTRSNLFIIAALTLAVMAIVTVLLLWDDVRLASRGVAMTRLNIETAAARYRDLGMSVPDAAHGIVSEMETDPQIRYAIFDASGKLLAGDSALKPQGQRIFSMLKMVPPPPFGHPPGVATSEIGVTESQLTRTAPGHVRSMVRVMGLHTAEDTGVRAGLAHHFESFTHFNGGFAVITADVGFISSGIWRYTLLIAVLGGLAMLAAWWWTQTQARHALAPVGSVTRALRRLAGGDFSRFTPTAEEEHVAGDLFGAYNSAAATAAAAVEERQRLEANMRQFVADAGHELRTPLTVIMGYIDVLHRGAIAEQMLARRILDTMRDEGERMRSLINKLLSLARMENAEVRNEARIDVAAVARKVVESARPIANSSTLALEADQAVFVHADEAELREALSNIIDNALKYAAGSVIQTTVSRRNGDAVVEVRDHGNGMTADERAHAFERFFRGHNRDIPGSGLGLAIAKRSVERAHGRISLESVPGNGTVVTIVLPVSDGVSG